MQALEKLMTVIIKVTGNYCNLRCGYCFYCRNDQQSKTIMSIDVVEKIVQQFLETGQQHCTFIWHGGEPMLAGMHFFEKVIELQERYKHPDQKIRNGIQTNATLITEEWATFFKQHAFGVGVSLDGCKHSHNRFRVYADGRGSFDDALRGIRILQSKGINPGYIQTVAKDNLPDLSENFRFFTEELGATSWGMNYYHGDTCGAMSGQSVTPEEKAAHVIQCIDLWLARNDANLKIREIESFFRAFLNRNVSDCHFGGTCGNFICIDWDGMVFPCDRFSSMKNFAIGNINSQTLSEILGSEALSKHRHKARELPEKCHDCRYLAHCHNGCAYNRASDISGIYHYCEARKKIFAHVEQIAIQFGICAKKDI